MNNWKETTLGEAVDIVDGDRGGNYPQNHEFCSDEYCLFLNTKNVPNTSFSFDEKMFITKDKDSILRKGKLKRGDFVLTTRGTVGNFAFYSEKVPFENIRINSGMVILRAKDIIIDRGFLNFYLKSHFFANQVFSLSSGTAQPQLPIKDLSVFEIVLPPLPEQKAIAAILSSFDDKIELLRRQNKTLEQIAQTIFKEWFVKFRIKNEELRIDKKTGLPEGWRMGKLEDIISLFDSKRIPLSSQERAKRKGVYPYYGATQIMDYIDDFIFDGIYVLLAEDGSVIDDQGYPVLQYVWGQIWVNNHAHILQGKNGWSTESLYLLLKKMPVSGIITGAVQLKINQENLLNVEIVLPDKMILEKFDSIIQPMFGRIRSNNSQIQTLSKLRDTLLPKLLKGEIRVKT